MTVVSGDSVKDLEAFEAGRMSIGALPHGKSYYIGIYPEGKLTDGIVTNTTRIEPNTSASEHPMNPPKTAWTRGSIRKMPEK